MRLRTTNSRHSKHATIHNSFFIAPPVIRLPIKNTTFLTPNNINNACCCPRQYRNRRRCQSGRLHPKIRDCRHRQPQHSQSKPSHLISILTLSAYCSDLIHLAVFFPSIHLPTTPSNYSRYSSDLLMFCFV